MPWPAARGRLGGPPLEEFGSLEAYLADLKRRYRHLRKRYGVVADLILVAPFLSLTLTLGKTFSRRLARARRIAHVREAAAVAAEQRRRL